MAPCMVARRLTWRDRARLGIACDGHKEDAHYGIYENTKRPILRSTRVWKATTVELALEPGQAGTPHRHPGPVFGYVLEGEYELGLDDQPTKVLKAGETFYEPTGCLHRVSKNPAAKGNTRVLAVVLHPRDARQITIPEPKK
jgi:quercetin dioxygenase-like cupin family protein